MIEIENLTKQFDDVQALDGLSLTARDGRVTGLLGPNGAGKTTLFNLISGVFPLDSGTIVFNETGIKNKKPHHLVELGIARTFQNVELFESMTVLENILVGQHTRNRCGMLGSILRFPWVAA